MKRSASVALGVVTVLGTAYAQQSADPCEPATFNAKICRSAIRGGFYCSGGTRVSTNYQQPYPYYYDRYRDYVSQGGVVNAAPAGTCPGRLLPVRGGFGGTGAVHCIGSRAGS